VSRTLDDILVKITIFICWLINKLGVVLVVANTRLLRLNTKYHTERTSLLLRKFYCYFVNYHQYRVVNARVYAAYTSCIATIATMNFCVLCFSNCSVWEWVDLESLKLG